LGISAILWNGRAGVYVLFFHQHDRGSSLWLFSRKKKRKGLKVQENKKNSFIKKQKKEIMKTVYIIIAFCAGLFLGHLLFPTEKTIKPPIAEAVQQTQNKLNTIDSAMLEAKVQFLQQNDSLKRKLATVNNLLSIHKSLLFSERNKVSELTNRIAASALTRTDSLLTDSLCTEINSLNAKTDSLINIFECRDSLMQSLVAIRDSQIEVCDRSYREAKDLILEQSLREQQLTKSLNVALKQLKRKRVQNKVLAAGMLFLSGITTTLYIKSRQ
jgi:hypothetical protein